MMTQTVRRCGLLFIAAMIAGGSAATAHSFPEAQSPSAGQTLAASPPAVTIKFDAPIEKLFAKLEVLDADGKTAVMGSPEVGADGVSLSVKLGQLKPGAYTVKWSVVCIDTHHTEGSYRFTVAGGGS